MVKNVNLQSYIGKKNDWSYKVFEKSNSKYSALDSIKRSGFETNNPILKELKEQGMFKLHKTNFWDLFKIEKEQLYC